MIRTIIQNGFDADYRISSQRAFLYGFLDTFFNSREVVLRNCAAEYFLLENVWFLEISVVCLLCWAWLGKAVNRIFRTTVAMVRFQRAMALCLFISAWMGMLA